MKILLTAINAKFIHSNPAVYSLRAYAGEQLKQHIQIAEFTINHHMSDILAEIYKQSPDIIAFSCYIWNWNMIRDLLKEIPKILPECPIWLGGPEVSFQASDILEQYPSVEGIMIGEGEETFCELVDYYVQWEKEEFFPAEGLSKIKGLALRTGYTPPRPLTDLSRLPFLYEDLSEFTNRIIYYESSRGCPFNCSYCLSSIDKEVRFRDRETVKKELQFFLDQKVPQVKFVDRTFNCSHEHALDIWQYILIHDNGVTNFHFEISADILNEEELTLLEKMRPGLIQLEIGVQSANKKTLEAICRNMDLKRLTETVSRIHQGQNIHTHLDLIAGLPYEDYESFADSFNRVYGMKPQQLQLGFLKVLKGSHMHEKASEYKISYLDKPPYEILFSQWLPYKDILRLKKIEEMVECYYNSSQYTNTLLVLQKEFPGAFQMFEELADFYEKKGYFVYQPSRGHRYEVLFEFIKMYVPGKEELYAQLLTYDMYLRENLKNRPSFTRDISLFKEEIRSFYKKEEEERKYLPHYQDYDARQMSKMNHLEPFSFPVWNPEGLDENPECMSGDCFVLFDYRQRSPLTHEAHVLRVPVERKIP